MLSRTDRSADDALGLAVLGHHADAGARWPRPATSAGQRAPSTLIVPAVDAGPRRRWPWPSRCGRSRAGRPGRPPRRRARRRSTSASSVPAGEARRPAGPARRRPSSVCASPKRVRAVLADLGDVAAEHRRDQPSRSVSATSPGVHPAAVAQDGDLLADPEDLVELVGDVEDGDAVARAAADHPGEPVDLARLQRRGRLVHDRRPGRRSDTARAIATICCTPSPSSPSGRRTSTSMP